MHTPRRKLPILVLAAGLACAVLAGVHAWMYRTPGARLAAGETYPDMREDASHHYIDLPWTTPTWRAARCAASTC